MHCDTVLVGLISSFKTRSGGGLLSREWFQNPRLSLCLSGIWTPWLCMARNTRVTTTTTARATTTLVDDSGLFKGEKMKMESRWRVVETERERKGKVCGKIELGVIKYFQMF